MARTGWGCSSYFIIIIAVAVQRLEAQWWPVTADNFVNLVNPLHHLPAVDRLVGQQTSDLACNGERWSSRWNWGDERIIWPQRWKNILSTTAHRKRMKKTRKISSYLTSTWAVGSSRWVPGKEVISAISEFIKFISRASNWPKSRTDFVYFLLIIFCCKVSEENCQVLQEWNNLIYRASVLLQATAHQMIICRTANFPWFLRGSMNITLSILSRVGR